jgi:hypothetical protein
MSDQTISIGIDDALQQEIESSVSSDKDYTPRFPATLAYIRQPDVIGSKTEAIQQRKGELLTQYEAALH